MSPLGLYLPWNKGSKTDIYIKHKKGRDNEGKAEQKKGRKIDRRKKEEKKEGERKKEICLSGEASGIYHLGTNDKMSQGKEVSLLKFA